MFVGPGQCSADGTPTKAPVQPWQMPWQQLNHPAQQHAFSSAVDEDAEVLGTPASIRHLEFGSDGAAAGGASPGSPAWSLLSQGGPSKEVLEEVTSRICEQYTVSNALVQKALHTLQQNVWPLAAYEHKQAVLTHLSRLEGDVCAVV